jgi:hypothetical protein
MDERPISPTRNATRVPSLGTSPFSDALQCAAVCDTLAPLIPGRDGVPWGEARLACDVACANKYLADVGAVKVLPPAPRAASD